MTYPPSPARTTDLFLFVARQPTPGVAKTRLGQAIGMERAAALYASFLIDLSARFGPWFEAATAYDFGWAYSPPDIDFAAVLVGLGCARPAAGVHLVPQEGEGLADRLTNLFSWAAARGYQRTVIMATDSPHLDCAVVDSAFAALDQHDVVLGRTVDGGYYLIGLHGVHDVLAGAPLSTGREADALVARSAALGLRVSELAPSFDVDEEADLRRLRAALAPDGRGAPATWRALRQLGLLDGDGTGVR
jgi:rSAM/selenodomain-associated transferase 1